MKTVSTATNYTCEAQDHTFVGKVSPNGKIEEYEIPAWLARVFFEVGKRLGHPKKGQHAK